KCNPDLGLSPGFRFAPSGLRDSNSAHAPHQDDGLMHSPFDASLLSRCPPAASVARDTENQKRSEDMFKGVDHIVVAVKDIDAAVGRYETVYGTKCSERRANEAAGLKMG